MTSEDTGRPCAKCHGTGQEESASYTTTTEPDVGTSVALGVALGMGYFPVTKRASKLVTKKITCTRCHGSKVEPDSQLQ